MLTRRIAVTLALLVSLLGALQSGPSAVVSPVSAQVGGVIAYTPTSTGDEIRLISPDGSNDRRLWAHGLDDPHDAYNIYNMSWRLDGGELAFASTHENWCSINYSDIFSVAANGSGYRRITQAPSCAALANYPKGTVKVPVKNVSFFGNSFTGFIYFQGAPHLQQLSLAPGQSTVVTFNDVADFGEGVLQIASLIDGANRQYDVASAVDVQAGGTVETGGMAVAVLQNMGNEARSPTWRHDGTRIGYAYGYTGLYSITAQPEPLDFGELIKERPTGPTFVEHLKYGPTAATASQILYQGYGLDVGEGIYLATEGSTDDGERLLTTEFGFELVQGLAWLPDGSGFVYAVQEYDEEIYEMSSSNLFEYSFATKNTKRLTNFSNAFARQLSISPDGTQIVFERGTTKDYSTGVDLWIVNRNGSNPHLLKADAMAPAWGPAAAQPPTMKSWVYLPLVSR